MSKTVRRRRGFTLVELLVVIGIIALLIAILMPALSKARDHANAIKCLSNMRQIGTAYMMHATEHRNYVPTAGLIHPPWNATPAGLGDTAKNKYIYYSEGGTERPMPMPAALATYLGQKFNASTPAQMKEEMASGPCQDLFVCPTQGLENILEGQMLTDFGWSAPFFKSSYVFNEEPLGFLDTPPVYQRGRGNLNRMKQTSETMMLMEGKPRGGPGGWLVIFALKNNTVLEDAFNGNGAGDRTNFEFARHKGKVNMVFMDGHAELINVTCRPNWTNPSQIKYDKKIYTVPISGFF